MIKKCFFKSTRIYSHSFSSAAEELVLYEKSPSQEYIKKIEYAKAKPFEYIPGPPQLPFFGNLLNYRLGNNVTSSNILNYLYVVYFWGPFSSRTYHKALKNRYDKYGPVVRENLAGRKIIHIFEPEDAQIVFQNEGKMPYIAPLQETALIYRRMKNLSLGLGNM